MKFSKAQIAALVLGYLRREKLPTAVDAFLNSCSYLHESDEKIKMGKYFVTRVGGLTLIDYLEEYSEIYAIVQARIEETDCYDRYDRPTLVQQLLFLLDKQQPLISTSTPVMSFSAPCELEATPAHELPGNSLIESDSSIPKSPKKRNARCKSKDREKDDVIDMTEVLTLSLLEKHELHEKIAEAINTAMNTPEVAKTVSDEHISAGASKELDAVIKTVIQRTEEDPLYNRLIDEIIGATNCENPKKLLPCSTPTTSLNTDEPPRPQGEASDTQNPLTDPMDDHNNDAIRSLIEAAQITDPPPAAPQPENCPISKNEPQPNGEVYVFDGSLDTYLKSSGAINSNLQYFNPTGLIVVPPPETAKQFYIVNNQPLLKVAVPPVVTEKEIMSMPTVIISDENPSTTAPCSEKCAKRNKRVKSKGVENAAANCKTKVGENVGATSNSEGAAVKNKGAEGLLVPAPLENVVITRQASHVRNLDFSTPSYKGDGRKKNLKSWDEDLRQLIGSTKDKSPSPKKKRPTTAKKKSKKPEEKPPEHENETEVEENKPEVEEPENANLMTPIKECVPKTPGGTLDTSSLHCTPFTAVLEEQLQGVDISSIPTPSIPITPGFALTPGDMLCTTNQRLTDYSTSSSYYQPSDSEQKTTMTDLIEESKKLDNLSPTTPEDAPTVNILSNVVIEKSKNNIIGKKNLNLIKHTLSSSSSESESDSDLETTKETVIDTIVCQPNSAKKNSNVAAIKEIINNVEVKNTLDEETRKKNLLSHLEEKRQRTIQKIKNPVEMKKPRAKGGRKKVEKTPKAPKVRKRNVRKKVASTEENTDEEAQKLVKGLAQRGIHLIHNKTPNKKSGTRESESCTVEGEDVTFDTRTYEDCEVVAHDNKGSKRRNIKCYDFGVMEKSMSANVFIEELNTELTRIIKWTNCGCLFDSTNVSSVKDTSEVMDELMDYCIVGSVREESPDISETKGGKKRKSKFSDDDDRKDKKNKTYENDLRLLKKINVDDFLDKVHGE